MSKIGISLIGITPQMGGNYQYALSLLKIIEGFATDSDFDLLVFFDNLETKESIQDVSTSSRLIFVGKKEKKSIFRSLVRMLAGLLDFKLDSEWIKGRYRLLDENGCSLIFYPYWHISSCITRTPSVVSIHDCVTVENPELMNLIDFIRLDLLIRSITKTAAWILVDSVYGRDLLCKSYRWAVGKAIVFPFSLPTYAEKFLNREKFFQDQAVMQTLVKYDLYRGYLFLPGRWGSYKNTQRVLYALDHLRKTQGSAPTLVLTGISDADAPRANEFIVDLGLANTVKVFGFVPDDEMIPLFAGAGALIFPTLLGPTSIPIYEAMSVGCPVIGPNLSGYPKLIASGGIIVDPYNVEDIARAILFVLDMENNDKLRQASAARYLEITRVDKRKVLQGLLGKAL